MRVWGVVVWIGWIGVGMAAGGEEERSVRGGGKGAESERAGERSRSGEQGVAEGVVWAPWQRVVSAPLRSVAARVVARERSMVAAEVGGRVAALPVRVGERVEKGAVLARLENELLRLAREEAVAGVRAAEVRLAQAVRLRAQAARLAGREVVSRDAEASAEEGVRLAEAERRAREVQRAIAEQRLEQTVVRAPFSGVVVEQLVGEGDWVTAGQPLVVLVGERVEVVGWVPEEWVDEVQVHEGVWIKRREAEGCPEQSRLRLLGVSGEVRGGGVVQVRWAPVCEGLQPGQSGRVVWQGRRGVVPGRVVTTWRGRVGVWLRYGERVAFVSPRLGLPGRSAEILLPEGWRAEETWVAVEGHGALGWERAGEGP
ncbi:MAG: efflux RND transporter periplasmic adaptor subunit [Hydrogenophilus sp.]|nr:efflux RND transporter periplasmic adaptor subunit [Hydrogenophilus sp.]